jgi:hypothetical protein
MASPTAARRPWRRCRPAHGWRRSAEQPGIVDEGAEEIDRMHQALPGGTRTTAASSGACRPISTSSRVDRVKLASARDSTVAPTLAPQPPQRMAMAEMACSLCSARRAESPRPAARRLRPSAEFGEARMKRRSIQSFQRQTQSPRAKSAPREATACRSPVLISASQRAAGDSGAAAAQQRFGAGSPPAAAHAHGEDAGLFQRPVDHRRAIAGGEDQRVGLALQGVADADEARPSSASPVSRSQARRRPASPRRSRRPPASRRCGSQAAGADLVTSARGARRRRARRARARRRGARRVVRRQDLRVGGKEVEAQLVRIAPERRSSPRSRYCIASVSSTPPAPAPTTAIVVGPACARTRASSASQRSLKRRIGFTGTACSAAPGDARELRRRADVDRQQVVGQRRRSGRAPARARSMPTTSSR